VLRGHVPCAPVNGVGEALADPQVEAREMIVEVDHPVFGRIREVGSPIKTAGAITRPDPAPGLGEHTDHYLREILGYSPRTIETLRGKGAIG
jgi:crotonobetainyl-CoA:carnitine CoA-transferase CaiB-like acyl-CoA transferase